MTKNSKQVTVDDSNDQPVDVRELGHASKRFLNKLAERQELYRPSSVERDYKLLNQELAGMLAEAGQKSVITPDWKVTFTQGTSSHIDVKKLLELGVDAKIIKKATVTKTYETVTVTARKGNAD